MIKKNGNIFRLETENTTLILRADTAEYLYYGKKTEAAGDVTVLRGGKPVELRYQVK